MDSLEKYVLRDVYHYDKYCDGYFAKQSILFDTEIE